MPKFLFRSFSMITSQSFEIDAVLRTSPLCLTPKTGLGHLTLLLLFRKGSLSQQPNQKHQSTDRGMDKEDMVHIYKGICLQCRRPWFNPWVWKIPWRRKWQPTPVFLPGEFHRQRNLVGYSPWGHRESDTTEQLTQHIQRDATQP